MKRKMLFIAFAFMFMLLIFCNESFANTNTTEALTSNYSYSDFFSAYNNNSLDNILSSFLIEQGYNINSSYYFINYRNNEMYSKYYCFDIIVSSNPLKCSAEYREDSIYSYFYYLNDITFYKFYNGGSENKAIIYSDNSGNYVASGSTSLLYATNSPHCLNHDIYLYNGDTLVFQGPPQMEEEIIPEKITLAQVLETEKETNPQMAMKEILIILPTILVVVVSYLGLRKALAMLSAILHRS